MAGKKQEKDEKDLVLLGRYLETGSEEAFAQLFERYKNLVFKVCVDRLGDVYLAEDAMQTVFFLLSRKAELLLKKKADLSLWLVATSRHIADRIRRGEERRARRERVYAEMVSKREIVKDVVEDERGMWEHLEEAMKRLSQPSRSAILMHYIEGKSWEEVGKVLGCSASAARMKAGRGMEKLRKYLAKAGIGLTSAALVHFISPDAEAGVSEHLEKDVLDVCLGRREVPAHLKGVLDAVEKGMPAAKAVGTGGVLAQVGGWIAGVVVAVGLGVGAVLWGVSGGKASVSGKDVAAASGEVVGGVVGVGECTLVRGDVRKVVRLRDEVREGDVLEVARGVLAMKGKGGGFVAAAEGSKVKVLGEGTGGGLRVQLLAGRVEVEGEVELSGVGGGKAGAAGGRRMWEERGGRLVDVTGRYPTMLFLRDYRVVDLGTLGGGVKAYDMNGRGEVVGVCRYKEGMHERAFLWRDGGMEILRGLERVRSRAVGINNKGEVAGYMGKGGSEKGFLWRNGELRELPYRREWKLCVVNAIGGGGVIAGKAMRWSGHSFGVLWLPDGKVDESAIMGVLSISVCSVGGRDVIVGGELAREVRGGKGRGRLPVVVYGDGGRWHKEVMAIGGYAGGMVNYVTGRIAVGICVEKGGGVHACIWRDGRLVDISAMFGAGVGSSIAKGVNASGWVVGWYEEGKRRSLFLWRDGSLWDVAGMVSVGDGVVLERGRRITDAHWILVNGMLKGKRRAFLLVPRESSVGRKEVLRET